MKREMQMTSVITWSVTGILLALLLGTYYQFIKKARNESKVDQKNITLVEVAGWKIKESVEKSSESTCDLLRIDINNINSHLLDDLFRSNVPFVIVNSMADWPATKEWTRFNFISKFGKRTVKTDSESTIVQGGGLASPSASFESLLAQVRNCSLRNSVECSDDFVFDTAIVRSIPELDQDIKVLPAFQNWDNPQQRRSQFSWHMLSLGPIQTGRCILNGNLLIVDLTVVGILLKAYHFIHTERRGCHLFTVQRAGTCILQGSMFLLNFSPTTHLWNR